MLYGCNSTGKSVFTSSVPLAIIMAQAGMWTAGKLKFKIFNRIITRLSGQDDIIKGHSSFIVEMLELRTILRNADKNTLVIGDELCRGTESLSGTALLISTLEFLRDTKSCYIFSTHLHNVAGNPHIKILVDNESLNIYHLESTYDEASGELIYNRKLKPGAGESIYGLEVAKSLDMDSKFITRAMNIRKELLGEPLSIINPRKSNFNDNLKDKCVICESRVNLHEHHIKEQSLADDQGLIGSIPKDAGYNTVTLCEDHHRQLHQGNLRLTPVTTSTGTIFTIIKNEN